MGLLGRAALVGLLVAALPGGAAALRQGQLPPLPQFFSPPKGAAPDLASIIGQLQKAAPHSAQSGKPANPLEGVFDWIKSQQKQATTSAAAAAKTAAAQTAQQSLGGFMAWAKQQADKAAEAAKKAVSEQASAAQAKREAEAKQAAQAKREAEAKQAAEAKAAEAKAAEAKHEEEAKRAVEAKAAAAKHEEEAARTAQNAWGKLVEVAKGAAAKTAQEEAPRIVAKVAKARQEARALSKAAVDSSIEEAEAKMRAARGAGDAASREAAERAAGAAARKALEDLFSWASADGAPVQKASEAASLHTEKGGAGRAEAERGDSSFVPGKEAEGLAERAEDSAGLVGRIAESVEGLAKQAEQVAKEGHRDAKALWQKRLPGATAAALKALKAVIGSANSTVHLSDTAFDLETFVKEFLAKAIGAARASSDPEEFKKAWQAVRRASTAAFEAQDDSRLAMQHSRDATLAVSAALAEAGWRAVSEVLRSEASLLFEVVKKAAKEREVAKLGAWLEGLSKAQPVAQVAWLKGVSEGMQTAAARGAMGKVQRAGKSVGKVGVEWLKAITQVMESKDARSAVAKAASSATRAASAVAAATAGTAADGLRAGLQDTVKRRWRRASDPKGPVVTWSGEWRKDGAQKGDLSGSYGGREFKGFMFSEPNATHERMLARGALKQDGRRLFDMREVHALGRTGASSTEAKYVVNGPKILLPAGGVAGSIRADPLGPSAAHLKGSSGAWGLASSLKADYDSVVSKQYGSKGKIGVTYSSPLLKKPFQYSTYFSTPAPKQKQR